MGKRTCSPQTPCGVRWKGRRGGALRSRSSHTATGKEALGAAWGGGRRPRPSLRSLSLPLSPDPSDSALLTASPWALPLEPPSDPPSDPEGEWFPGRGTPSLQPRGAGAQPGAQEGLPRGLCPGHLAQCPPQPRLTGHSMPVSRHRFARAWS